MVKFRGHFSQRQLAIKLEPRFEIRGSEPGPCIALEMLAQLLDICAGQGEADRVRVSAVAGKKFVARFDGLQQMKRRDRSSRTVGLVAVTRDDQGWPPWYKVSAVGVAMGARNSY